MFVHPFFISGIVLPRTIVMDIPAKSPARVAVSALRLAGLRSVFVFPWWLAALILAGVSLLILINSNRLYTDIFTQLSDGIRTTLYVAFVSYAGALVIGLVVGLIRANPPKPGYTGLGLFWSFVRLVIYNLATLYVQVLRGLPILVTLLIVAFVIIPQVNNYVDATFGIQLRLRGSSPPSAIIALAFTYGAFLSETFRAGIQSIAKGQIEAARSLGMTYPQTMRFIVLPQAIRRILPPLGNDMVAMIKDSSLVAILGIQDITQLAKLSSSSSFRYLETYLLAAAIYLTMTTIGALVVRFIERHFSYE